MKSKKFNSIGVQWLIGLSMATLLFVLIAFFGDLRYTSNDDGVILRPFMGFDSTQLPTFHLTLHAVLLYPLRWLSMAFPGVAWFSYMQLAFLWFACALSVKSIAGCFARAGRSVYWSLPVGAVYLGCFAMSYCCKVTFTVTAAVLGAAAVLQVLSIDGENAGDGQVFRSLLLALIPVVLAYGLRQSAALPILAFCGLAFLYQGVTAFGVGQTRKRSWKPLWRFAGVAAAVMIVLAGGRALEIGQKNMGEYLRWQEARSQAMDYYDMAALPDELLDQIGWTRTEAELVAHWYFLDPNINADAFEAITAYQRAHDYRTLGQRLAASMELLKGFSAGEPLAWRACLTLLAAVILCAAAMALRGRKTLWLWLCLGLACLASFLMLVYLGWNGRLPLRAVLTVVLPLAALVFGLLPACLPNKRHGAALAVVLALGVAVAGLGVYTAVPTANSLRKPAVSDGDEATLINPFADMDELAADDPDSLFIYDDTFASDIRMFPSTANGTPHNVLFWGGWAARSPEYQQCLAAFGIEPEEADYTLFLRDDVYLVRGVLDSEPRALIAYMQEQLGQTVESVLDSDWGGAHTSQLYTAE